jgi:hypothetical protein
MTEHKWRNSVYATNQMHQYYRILKQRRQASVEIKIKNWKTKWKQKVPGLEEGREEIL